MPKVDRGSIVVPIEQILRDPEKAFLAIRIATRCGCILVDMPFIATVSINGLVVDVAIGAGSLLCSPSCGAKGWILESPAWASGVVLGEAECGVAGQSLEKLLDELGFRVNTVNGLTAAIDYANRFGNVIVSLPDLEGLEVEKSAGVCGVIEAVNPLHPASVVGKPYLTGCARPLAEPVSRVRRLLAPLLRVRGRTVMWQYRGLNDALILGFDYTESSDMLRLSTLLGVLYTCGVKG